MNKKDIAAMYCPVYLPVEAGSWNKLVFREFKLGKLEKWDGIIERR